MIGSLRACTVHQTPYSDLSAPTHPNAQLRSLMARTERSTIDQAEEVHSVKKSKRKTKQTADKRSKPVLDKNVSVPAGLGSKVPEALGSKAPEAPSVSPENGTAERTPSTPKPAITQPKKGSPGWNEPGAKTPGRQRKLQQNGFSSRSRSVDKKYWR